VKSDFWRREEEGDRTASTRDYRYNLIEEYTAIVLGMHVTHIFPHRKDEFKTKFSGNKGSGGDFSY